MPPATLVVYGRYWYDFVTLAVVAAFFLIEMILLFRNSRIGWSMTRKCLVLVFLFCYAILNPAPLQPEDVTIGAVLVRTVLIAVLVHTIYVLVDMRVKRQTVVVGREGTPSDE